MLQYTSIKIEKGKSTRLKYLGKENETGRAEAIMFYPGMIDAGMAKALKALTKHAAKQLELPTEFRKRVIVTGVILSYRNEVRSVLTLCRVNLSTGHVWNFNTPTILESSDDEEATVMSEEYIQAVNDLVQAAEKFRESPEVQFGPLFGQTDAPAEEEVPKAKEAEKPEDGTEPVPQFDPNGAAKEPVAGDGLDTFFTAPEEETAV